MKFLGIHFVPLNEPLQKRLETFWAGFWFVMFGIGLIIVYVILFYLFFSRLWWFSLLIVAWTYLDRETQETGGRPFNWIQNWSCWRYLTGFYESEVLYDDQFKLEPDRKYLFCGFPHGIVTFGAFSNFSLKTSPFRQRYPDVDMKIAMLKINFFVPVIREVWLGMNLVSCSARSLNYVLSTPGGGCVGLFVGGAEEASFAKPGVYKFFLKKRKGFVKIALGNGTSLVPAITFGENDCFDQVEHPCLRKFQRFVKRHTGVLPTVFNGRGLFQYSFGMFPRKTKMTTVLGNPIHVSKVKDPTQEQIDELHAKFVEELQKLFEKFKYKCLTNPEDTQVEIC